MTFVEVTRKGTTEKFKMNIGQIVLIQQEDGGYLCTMPSGDKVFIEEDPLSL